MFRNALRDYPCYSGYIFLAFDVWLNVPHLTLFNLGATCPYSRELAQAQGAGMWLREGTMSVPSPQLRHETLSRPGSGWRGPSEAEALKLDAGWEGFAC